MKTRWKYTVTVYCYDGTVYLNIYILYYLVAGPWDPEGEVRDFRGDQYDHVQLYRDRNRRDHASDGS